MDSENSKSAHCYAIEEHFFYQNKESLKKTIYANLNKSVIAE